MLDTDRIIEILGFTVGLFYLWYEYHASAKLWIASIIMPLISMYLYFRKGIYADFAINIYYVIIAIYGYLAWTFGTRKQLKTGNVLRISHINGKYLAHSAAVFAALWAGIFFVLAKYTDSTVPVADAFTTALSIVAMWMLARKFIEQWLAWIAVDVVCVGLYAYKGLLFYPILYAVYTVIAILGYAKWRKLMAQGM